MLLNYQTLREFLMSNFWSLVFVERLFYGSIIATLLYHFPPEKIQYYFFMKNIAIVGGLITLALLFK